MDQNSGSKCPRCGHFVFAAEHPGANSKSAECQRCRYYVLEALMKAGRPLPRCRACKSGAHDRHVVSDTLILAADCAKLVCARCNTVALELPKDFRAP
jgi:hypothetical protein